METANVTITGSTPLLMHADNIEWADAMDEWRGKAENRKVIKAGDDRTPPWRWLGCLYYDHPQTGVITMPAEYIMRTIMAGAAEIPTGRGKKTFKAQSQSGMLCRDFHWPLLVEDGHTVAMVDVNTCKDLKTFSEQVARARQMGFDLFVKRARVGNSKHVRVRPRFDKWSTTGEIIIMDEAISKQTLHKMLEIAGQYKGLGDWRPNSGSPGSFGLFTATVD